MIDTLEDHYRWDSVGQVFVLLEQEPGLVDVRPHRVDVQAARIHAGWELMTTVTLDELNAQPGVIDVWIRTDTD
ncbi:hypothetical protein [Aeromicrobium yanjiei]|uniref:Uncharacterized protein n=1 Tax=Aeromicrobium yanjiei TaxID=2662028 RepID=A0A5Q2M9W7_9ACTN|nr:hypothetical protein [Aeromicrobium yanjiei]QGG39897.1 hypothetical protein GEV26_00060 [Aeromicrobium yanjiei]